MNKIELKKTAIEALSLSGALYQGGRYAEAKDAAERAWNAYFELQKQRGMDEDFTDLIYTARAQYEKCQEALEASPHDHIHALMHKARNENGGDYKAVLEAAEWILDTANWQYLPGEKIGEYLSWTARMLNETVNERHLPNDLRAPAAVKFGSMYLLPKYGQVNMEAALKCYKAAADLVSDIDNPNKKIVADAFGGVVECASILGNYPLAMRYAQQAMDLGIDMGIFFWLAYMGLVRKEKSASDLVDSMVDAGTWQGLLLKALNLLWEWQESDFEDQSKYDQVTELVNNPMSLYYDNHTDTEGGNACLAFCMYKLFLDQGLPFLNGELMQYITDSVNEGYVWAYNYYGKICDLAADCFADEDDKVKTEHYRSEAEKFLRLAANQGNREALKHFYKNFIKGKAEPDIEAIYKNAAEQYGITD